MSTDLRNSDPLDILATDTAPEAPGRARHTDRLPGFIYVVLAGLVFWMVLAAWSFAGAGYVDVALTVVTGFFIVLMGIPFALWLVWRANRDPDAKPEKPEPFADWVSETFEIWQGSRTGASAAVEIILPVAAAALGMTAFAIVFHIAAMHAGA
jgi:hypothetical protein